DGGGTLRLFALHGDERLTAFAPGVVHLDGGADDERATNERQEQGGVFAEEPASLLRVLRRSGGGGIVGCGRGGEGAFGVPHPSPQRVGHLSHPSVRRARQRVAGGCRRVRAGLRQRHPLASWALTTIGRPSPRDRPSDLAALAASQQQEG